MDTDLLLWMVHMTASRVHSRNLLLASPAVLEVAVHPCTPCCKETGGGCGGEAGRQGRCKATAVQLQAFCVESVK